jgi:hypothetical protein
MYIKDSAFYYFSLFVDLLWVAGKLGKGGGFTHHNTTLDPPLLDVDKSLPRLIASGTT